MKRLILVAAMLLALPGAAWASCGGASPRWIAANPPTLAEMQDCISKASPGDTIVVTGNATWTSALTFSRGVHFVGSGNPTITSTNGRVFNWEFGSAAYNAHDTLSIKGFTLDGNNATTSWGLITLYGSSLGYVRLIVIDNTLRNVSGRGVYISARPYGVIARNTFSAVYEPLGAYGDNQISWSLESQEFGADENIYFEDNLSLFTPTNGDRGLGGGQGGRYVARYNDWDYAAVSASVWVWGVHGLQAMGAVGSSGGNDCAYEGLPLCDPDNKTCGNYSNMVTELYGNKVYGAGYIQDTWEQRGGWNVFHHNQTTATNASGGLVTYMQYSCDACQMYTPPSYVQHVSNSYSWNNLHNGTKRRMEKNLDFCADKTIPSPSQYTITKDRDYFTDAETAFDGSSGVGCGTLAARSACTKLGVGYWATNQSCSDLTGMVGRNPATPISGTLYQCDASLAWVKAFEPYQYPHPLTVAPAAPTAARVK